MEAIRRTALIVLLVSLSQVWLASLAAQQAAASSKAPLTDARIEAFLLEGEILSSKENRVGINRTQRATLSDGEITHDAQIQTVDVSKLVFNPPGRPAELNFKDTYRYNIAAYRLARLLTLWQVPVSVERRVDGDMASVTWWADDVAMDEGQRRKTPKTGWSTARTSAQIQLMRVFDALIANTDRNLGNLLWTRDGTMWMIDHTRAFRLTDTLPKAHGLVRCERKLFEAMRTLTEDSIKKAVGESLTGEEINAVLKRRDLIVKLFEAKIKQHGERIVLYSLGLEPAAPAAAAGK